MPARLVRVASWCTDGWKQAFDSDPADRKGSGVKRYLVMRAVDDLNHVLIDLEFSTVAQAEGLLASVRTIWGSDAR